jgi:transcriptional regulator with XRE-family HTH domain
MCFLFNFDMSNEEIIMFYRYTHISFKLGIMKCKLTVEDMPMYEKNTLDMMAFGKVVKKAREDRGWTREQLGESLNVSLRHIQYIETRGQHPSLQLFFGIVTLLNISTDQFFFPDTTEHKSTQCKQLITLIKSMDENDLFVITETAKALQGIKKNGT